MTFTQAGRDQNARNFSARYLAKLRQATARIAPVSAPGWQSDFAIGFLSGHVTIGLQTAFAKDTLRRFHKPWPAAEEIFALHKELIPEPMGFPPLAFRTAFDQVIKRWPMDNAQVTPVAEGALLAGRIVCDTLAPFELRPQRMDDWMKRISSIEKEFSRLPGRHPAVRLVWRDRARLYRYHVLRTLGMTAFGISTEQACRFALED